MLHLCRGREPQIFKCSDRSLWNITWQDVNS
uniref:Uncharacterized protein n=1 Tax=Siphoviridae sp. ctbvd11 TaxID=2825567 RepID=A0A8S5QD27_9CAUD|nr:MAG TPA: hypothetical protein [Siphoviridae sp. ctbvd11]